MSTARGRRSTIWIRQSLFSVPSEKKGSDVQCCEIHGECETHREQRKEPGREGNRREPNHPEQEAGDGVQEEHQQLAQSARHRTLYWRGHSR